MNGGKWTVIFYNLMAVIGMSASIVGTLIFTVMISHNQPVNVQLAGWRLAAAPSSLVAKLLKSQEEKQPSINDLDMVFVQNEVLSKTPDHLIDNLYESLLDSLRDEEMFSADLPKGCIDKYCDGDSAAIVFEFYLKCDCSLNDLMNILYISIDLRDPNLPSVYKSILCEGISRTGYPSFTQKQKEAIQLKNY